MRLKQFFNGLFESRFKKTIRQDIADSIKQYAIEDQQTQDRFDREFEFNIDCMVNDYVRQWRQAKHNSDLLNLMATGTTMEEKWPVAMIYLKNPRHAMRSIIPGCKSKWDGVDIGKLVHDKAQEIIKTLI